MTTAACSAAVPQIPRLIPLLTRKAAISAKRRPLDAFRLLPIDPIAPRMRTHVRASHGSNVLRALSHISLSDGWGGWVGEQMAVSRNPDK